MMVMMKWYKATQFSWEKYACEYKLSESQKSNLCILLAILKMNNFIFSCSHSTSQRENRLPQLQWMNGVSWEPVQSKEGQEKDVEKCLHPCYMSAWRPCDTSCTTQC